MDKNNFNVGECDEFIKFFREKGIRFLRTSEIHMDLIFCKLDTNNLGRLKILIKFPYMIILILTHTNFVTPKL